MCADSMALDSDEETWIPCTKIFRVRGHIVGFAGSYADIKPLVDWYRQRKMGEPPPTDDDTEMLILTPEGLRAWSRHEGFHVVEGDRHAIGAGKQIALCALDMGGDTKKAAEMAVKYSVKCAGRIVSRRLSAST